MKSLSSNGVFKTPVAKTPTWATGDFFGAQKNIHRLHRLLFRNSDFGIRILDFVLPMNRGRQHEGGST